MAISEAWVDFVAGWLSGGISVLVCQPVDTVLTRLQAGPALVPATTTANTTSPTVSVQTRGLVSQSGWTALWRGSSAMISAVPLQNALLMGGYGIGKQWSDDSQGDYDTMISVFVGGCTGGVVQSFIMSPVELIKVNQQVIGQPPKAARREIVQGLLSSHSWRGLTATLLRDGIPHGVWFASYEWCKTVLGPQLQDSSGAQVTIPLVSGAFAATVAWTVGYPFDIIKTRIQAQKATTTNSIYQTGVELIQEANGQVLQGLYRGFGLKLLRSVPASMIGFTTYELVAGQMR